MKGTNWHLKITALTILCMLFSSWMSYSQQGVFDEQVCAYYKVEMLPGDSVRLTPSQDCTTLTGKIARKIDLNLDGRNDFIINFGSCGNWGDCVYGIYVQQTDDNYQCVFQPDYWYSGQWDVLESEYTMMDGLRWMKLRLYTRTDYVGGTPGVVPISLLQFDGGSYRNLKLESLNRESENAVQSETFEIEKEVENNGRTYQVGRLQLPGFQYGPLTLRIKENGTIRDHVAAPVDYLEISDVDIINLKGRPFFFVKGRYQLFLIDLEKEIISSPIRPGLGVDYGEDAISGVMNGFQFFDGDQYLIGIAVSYGLFCFNVADIVHPKELLRYSSYFSDLGQPYFFLEPQDNGLWSGLVSQSDTLEKSSYISGFYTETQKARYLFKDALLFSPEDPYVDPAIDPAPKPFVLLFGTDSNHQKTPWVIDLKKAKLIKGKPARRFSTKQSSR